MQLSHQRLVVPTFDAGEDTGRGHRTVLLPQPFDRAAGDNVVLARLERGDLEEIAACSQVVAREQAWHVHRLWRSGPAHGEPIDGPLLSGLSQMALQFAVHEMRVHYPAVDERRKRGELPDEFLLEARGLP